jgi:hypothetical protein
MQCGSNLYDICSNNTEFEEIEIKTELLFNSILDAQKKKCLMNLLILFLKNKIKYHLIIISHGISFIYCSINDSIHTIIFFHIFI